MIYYNEIDPFCCKWLQELMDADQIQKGLIDDRDIREVQPNDLKGFRQCHFFAGIGGWSLALRLAGWPDKRPVWTGSCPCQPFSAAGKRKGTDDERHLWPAFRWLIAQCRPATVFGEQVASKDGRRWLSGVRVDLEALGYGVGAADLCAAGLGAPHIRQRLFWLANTDRDRNEPRINQFSLGETASGEVPSTISLGRSMCFGNWDTACILGGDSGKQYRIPIEPGIFPLAHGLPRKLGPELTWLRGLVKSAGRNRVGRLKGYGNSISPQITAEFIKASK